MCIRDSHQGGPKRLAKISELAFPKTLTIDLDERVKFNEDNSGQVTGCPDWNYERFEVEHVPETEPHGYQLQHISGLIILHCGDSGQCQEIEERAQFAYEACVIMRNRLYATVVYEEFGWDVEETINYVRNVEFREQFQTFLFQRVIPNLKRVGMLTDNIRPKFEKMGVLQFEHSPDDKDLDWATI